MIQEERRMLWWVLISDYRRSSLPTSEWCRKHRVTQSQLRYWLKQFDDNSKPPIEFGFHGKVRQSEEEDSVVWTPVQIAPEEALSSSTQGIVPISKPHCQSPDKGQITVCIGAARIEVHPGFDPALLADVLKVVTASC